MYFALPPPPIPRASLQCFRPAPPFPGLSSLLPPSPPPSPNTYLPQVDFFILVISILILTLQAVLADAAAAQVSVQGGNQWAHTFCFRNGGHS